MPQLAEVNAGDMGKRNQNVEQHTMYKHENPEVLQPQHKIPDRATNEPFRVQGSEPAWFLQQYEIILVRNSLA